MGDDCNSLKCGSSRIIMSSMNKRHLHHLWRTFRVIKPRYFLLAAAICSVVCVIGLRANNQHMAELRDAVYAADKDNTDVEGALHNLQAYVTAHMNTSLSTGGTTVYPPIQLEYTYQRLVQAQSASQQSANADLYTRAQAYCQAQNSTDFSGRNRVPCIEQYVTEHGLQAAKSISPSLYQFDFVAPKWSPDLAGWSLLLTLVLLLTAVVKFAADRYLKRLLS